MDRSPTRLIHFCYLSPCCQVTFVNASGLSEAGLDHGGLTKELLEATVTAAMQPGYGLFEVAQGSGLAYPSPAAEAIPQGLALLDFIGGWRGGGQGAEVTSGTLSVAPHLCASLPLPSPPLLSWIHAGMLVGKALYEGILLPDLALAPPLVMALQGARPGVDDLAAVDAGLATGLTAVRGYSGDVQDLGLTFSVELDNFGRVREAADGGTLGCKMWLQLKHEPCAQLPGVSALLERCTPRLGNHCVFSHRAHPRHQPCLPTATQTVSYDLLPGGASIEVTNDNRTLYCHLLADFHLNRRCARESGLTCCSLGRCTHAPPTDLRPSIGSNTHWTHGKPINHPMPGLAALQRRLRQACRACCRCRRCACSRPPNSTSCWRVA
jgi:hypothetical protein